MSRKHFGDVVRIKVIGLSNAPWETDNPCGGNSSKPVEEHIRAMNARLVVVEQDLNGPVGCENFAKKAFLVARDRAAHQGDTFRDPGLPKGKTVEEAFENDQREGFVFLKCTMEVEDLHALVEALGKLVFWSLLGRVARPSACISYQLAAPIVDRYSNVSPQHAAVAVAQPKSIDGFYAKSAFTQIAVRRVEALQLEGERGIT